MVELIFFVIVAVVYAYESYKANKARREYERKAQRAVEVLEGINAWIEMEENK